MALVLSLSKFHERSNVAVLSLTGNATPVEFSFFLFWIKLLQLKLSHKKKEA